MRKPWPVLRQPNNILALEYLKAIRRNSFNIKPLAVVRKGAGHDEIEAEKDILSASELRRRLRAGENAGTLLPKKAAAVFDRETKEGRTALDKERQKLLMLARLRFLEKEDFDALPDAGDGFGERLWTAVQKAASYEEVLNTAATRRFPMARARRCCLAAVLGLRDGYKKGNVPYARVLAFRERGRMLLREAGDLGRIQLLTKAAHSSALDERGRQIFCLGARAHDFYTLSYQKEEARVCGEDWRKGPFICI